ncbi:MAG TPA: glycosyltransferase [Elusimicrobiota bacterium]|nr:glycosyltransferase [Elusimicrobiota bacterium]
MKKPAFDHLLITRFNVAWPDGPNQGLDPGWLEARFQLFERFCLPSVRAQSCSNFRWLILMDERTPAEYRNRIEAHARWENLHPVYLRRPLTVLDDGFLDVVRAHARPDVRYLITTRLDNDDAIARHFIQAIQEAFRGVKREVLEFPCGYVWNEHKLYRVPHYPSNPFSSLIEERDEFTTVYGDTHESLAKSAPVRVLARRPSWIQVVHGGNIANRVRGVRCRLSAQALGRDFALDIGDGAPTESILAYAADYASRWRDVLADFKRGLRRAGR